MVLVEQADGLCVVRGALRLLNLFAGSRNVRVVFFTFGEIGATNSYATGTSASAEASIAYGNKESKIGRKFSGSPSTNKF